MSYFTNSAMARAAEEAERRAAAAPPPPPPASKEEVNTALEQARAGNIAPLAELHNTNRIDILDDPELRRFKTQIDDFNNNKKGARRRKSRKTRRRRHGRKTRRSRK